MIFTHLANDLSNKGVMDLYSMDSVSKILRVPIDVWKLCVQANLQQMIPHSWDWEKLFGLNSKKDYKRIACRIYKTPCKGDLLLTLSYVAGDYLNCFMHFIRKWPQLLDKLVYNECYMLRIDSRIPLDPDIPTVSKWAFYCYDNGLSYHLPVACRWFTYTNYMYDPVHIISLPEMIFLMHNKTCQFAQPRDWIGCKSIVTHLALSKVIDMKEIASQ